MAMRKQEWQFLFHQIAEICPQDNPYFAEEQKKIQKIEYIVSQMSGKELEAWAASLRNNLTAQKLYRDGHWLDSAEDYNTKTQTLLDLIYDDLMAEQIAKGIKTAVRVAAKLTRKEK